MCNGGDKAKAHFQWEGLSMKKHVKIEDNCLQIEFEVIWMVTCENQTKTVAIWQQFSWKWICVTERTRSESQNTLLRKIQNLSSSEKSIYSKYRENLLLSTLDGLKINWKRIIYPSWRKNNFESLFFCIFCRKMWNLDFCRVCKRKDCPIAGQTMIVRALSTPDQ